MLSMLSEEWNVHVFSSTRLTVALSRFSRRLLIRERGIGRGILPCSLYSILERQEAFRRVIDFCTVSTPCRKSLALSRTPFLVSPLSLWFSSHFYQGGPLLTSIARLPKNMIPTNVMPKPTGEAVLWRDSDMRSRTRNERTERANRL